MYGFNETLDTTMEAAEEKVRAALAEEGFGVLTEIDVQKVMKAKLDIDRPGYKILGACNPVFANESIGAEPDIGLLLPCNVLLRDEGEGKTSVNFMDPVAVLGMVDNPKIAEIAATVQAGLKKVAAKL